MAPIEGDDDMNESAALVARHLRADVPVRRAWRDDLLARIDADRGAPRRDVWRMRPALAIAAAAVFIIIGAAIGRSSMLTPPPRISEAPPSASSVRFVYVAPGAARVTVAGDFNQWNASNIPMRRLNDGTWIVDVRLTPGRYAYSFVVDGKLEADPSAPRAADTDFGVSNSIVMVSGR